MIEISRFAASKQMAIPGIIGGLGPLAHVEFEQRLIEINKQRGASGDRDYPVWVLIGATNIPDRTKSLMGEVEDCTPWLVHYGKLLESVGADFVVVTCNTAHAFYDRVQSQLNIPWIHLIESTARFIVQSYPTIRRVGVLATSGTQRAGLYQEALDRVGLIPIFLPLGSQMQKQVMKAIYHPDYGVKATGISVSEGALTTLSQAVDCLQRQRAELVIAGCTELSVVLRNFKKLSLPWVDPLEVLAGVTLDLAYSNSSVRLAIAV